MHPPSGLKPMKTLKTMTTIIMRTSEGDIKINLFDDETPETVANFLGLATGERGMDRSDDRPAFP